jgi:inhibitor of KinA
MTDQPKIFPLGDNAVTIDFGNEISVALNDKSVSLAAYLDANPFPGFVEAVPAYSSVAVFYDLTAMRDESLPTSTVFDAVRSHIDAAVAKQFRLPQTDSQTVDIPVDFGDDAALDMDFLCDHSGLSRSEVVDLFCSRIYRVYMLGFLPGFAYMGDVDDRIAVPRRDSPRLRVPKGSVGIAGRQTGIYPLESPGGWQILGRTRVEMFRPDDAVPCALKPGDGVRFVPID